MRRTLRHVLPSCAAHYTFAAALPVFRLCRIRVSSAVRILGGRTGPPPARCPTIPVIAGIEPAA